VFGFFGGGTIVLTGMLFFNQTYESFFQAFRYGVFQFVSAVSCTGFQTAGSLGNEWSAEAQLIVSFGMVVGAAAGSTVGGIKLIRLATLTKGTWYRITNVFYPKSALRSFKLDGRVLTDVETAQKFEEGAIIAFLWVVFLALGMFVLLVTLPIGADGYSLQNVMFEVASAQGNVGLSSGITGAAMPSVIKVTFLFNMWIGRLEIVPVLVLLRSLFQGTEVYR
jgi:trk system potassium uptake protein